MKRSLGIGVSLLLFGIGSASYAAEPTKSEWQKKMQALYQTLASLLTDISSDQRFRDPANHNRIEKETEQLASLAHDIDSKEIIRPDGDPTLPIVSGMLASEAKQALVGLRNDNRAYARSILRSIPSYCIACHTRNTTGPQFAQLSIEPTSSSLTPFDRGQFFAASRQFDRALAEFKKVILDTKAAESYNNEWGDAIQQSLAIAVRTKNDSKLAKELVQAVLDSKYARSFLRDDATAWKDSIVEWEAEPRIKTNSEEGLYAEAMRLMARARQVQEYPMDRTAHILYLRASAITHDLLQAAPNGKHLGEALLLSGLSYEALDPLRGSTFHNLYYETCIRRAPHTDVAGLCYKRIEQSTILGFTGSAGTNLPESEKRKLAELKQLSLPHSPTPIQTR